MAKPPPQDSAPASGSGLARRLGTLVRQRREAQGMHQNELALATGLGRRFIIDLEAGKPSCQLGKALLVAEAVGLRLLDLMTAASPADNALLPDLPDADTFIPADGEEPAP